MEKKITLSINPDSVGNYAVFGYAKDATIKNLKSTGEINYSNTTGTSYVAGIVAYSRNTTVTNCTNYTTINVNSISSTSCVGGVVAYGLMDTIKRCSNLGDINVNSTIHNKLGGIAGHALSTPISYCSNVGAITSTGSRVGGIVGYHSVLYNANSIDTLFQCINIGAIKGTVEVGGIAGYFSTDRMVDCANSGWINGDSAVGGLIGSLYGARQVIRCLNTGVVQGITNVYALIGFRNGYYPTVSNCYYDNQMAPLDAIQGMTNPTSVHSRSTNELTQPLVRDVLGDAWTMYPQENLYSNSTPIISNQFYSYPVLKAFGWPISYLASFPVRLAPGDTWDDVKNVVNLDHQYHYGNYYWPYDVVRYSLDGEWFPWDPNSQINTGPIILQPIVAMWFMFTWKSNMLEIQHGAQPSNGCTQGTVNNPFSYYGPSELTASMADGYGNICKRIVPIITTGTFKIPVNNYATYGFEASEVTPNIVTNNAVIDINTATEGNLNVSIFDVSGYEVIHVTNKHVPAQSQTQVELNNLHNLASGSYMVAVSIGNNVIFKKFIKQ